MEPGLVPAGAVDLPIGVDQQSGRLPTSTQQSAAFPHAQFATQGAKRFNASEGVALPQNLEPTRFS